NTDVAWLAGGFGIFLAVLSIAFLLLVVAAVISALVDSDTSVGGKLLWVLFILWVPLFGAVAWFVVGKRGHLNRFLGIDKGRARHTIPTSVGQHSDVAHRANYLRHA